MAEKKIKIARLWSRYDGNVPSRTPIILGLDNQKFETVCIYLKKSSDESNFLRKRALRPTISQERFFFGYLIFL